MPRLDWEEGMLSICFFFPFFLFFSKLFYIKKEGRLKLSLRSCLFIFIFLVISVLSPFKVMVVGYTLSQFYLYCTMVSRYSIQNSFSCINLSLSLSFFFFFFTNLCDLVTPSPIFYINEILYICFCFCFQFRIFI